MLNIDRDLGRFRDIVKGRVRRDLRKYMQSGELLGRKGKETVSIPLPQIGIPRLRYGKNQSGVGQGSEGEGPGEGQQAGDAAGDHLLEVELTIDMDGFGGVGAHFHDRAGGCCCYSDEYS